MREAFFDVLRRHRQPIDKARYLQCIVHRRGDCGTCAIDAGLAGAFDAERIEWRGRILANEYVDRRHLGRGYHQIIRQCH
jgi:hypothetical protein